jgi:hypothetical protein
MDITMSQGETQEETINTVIEPTTQNMNGTVDPNLELSRDSTFHQSRVTDPIKMAGSLLNTEAITKTKLGVPKQKKRSKHSRKTKDSEGIAIYLHTNPIGEDGNVFVLLYLQTFRFCQMECVMDYP